MSNKLKYQKLSIRLIIGVFVFVSIQYGCNSGDTVSVDTPKEGLGEYVISEYFKSNVIAAKTNQKELIELAFKERVKHGDKERGIIKFYEKAEDTATAYGLWAYVEYHFPANPEKENAKDNYGNKVEVKIMK